MSGNTLASDARVQLPDAALSSLTQPTIFLGSVKCVATSNVQWVTAVEDCGYKLPDVAVPLRVINVWVAGNSV